MPRWKRAIHVVSMCVCSHSVVVAARAEGTPPTKAFPDAPPQDVGAAPASERAQSLPSVATGTTWTAPNLYGSDPYRHHSGPWLGPVARDASAPPAQTEHEVDRWASRPWLFEGHLSVAGPFGVLGASVAYDFVPAFGVVAGGGLGATGLQTAAGVRARVPLGSVALGVELTWSGGGYEYTTCHGLCLGADYDAKHWDFAHWLNLSPAVELRSQGGFSARFYLGYGRVLNPGDGTCYTQAYSGCHNADYLWFVGLALGGAT